MTRKHKTRLIQEENARKIGLMFLCVYKCTYPFQRGKKIICNTFLPVNGLLLPVPMYNSVSGVNLHNTSAVPPAFCYSSISEGGERRAHDLSGNRTLSKQIQLVEGKAAWIFNLWRVRISNTASNSFQAWLAGAVPTLTGTTETEF